MPVENSTTIEESPSSSEPKQGETQTGTGSEIIGSPGDEGLPEEGPAVTDEGGEETTLSNQSESATQENVSSSVDSPLQEPTNSLNQTETVAPAENITQSNITQSNGVIAFVSGPFEEHEADEIYVMNADGSGQTKLTNNTQSDTDPSWSPDGDKIAFSRSGDNGEDEIYVMNADGSGQTRLTNNGYSPSWSPDGDKIAFVSSRDVNSDFAGPEIYTMNANDGSDVTRLTNNEHNDLSPDWGSTTTSPPTGGNDGSGHPTTHPEQTINEAMSTIQNLDSIPQSLKTKPHCTLETSIRQLKQ
jgi:WD40 repeat protein